MTTTEPLAPELPQLVTRARLRRDLGISERQVDHIFRELPVIKLPGSRRVFVRLADVEVMLRHYSFSEDQ